jgi:hypothetical protein
LVEGSKERPLRATVKTIRKDWSTKDMILRNLVERSMSGTNGLLAITFSNEAYSDLRRVAANTSRPMDDVIRIGIGLYKAVASLGKDNHRLVIVSQAGKPVKEIILPSL